MSSPIFAESMTMNNSMACDIKFLIARYPDGTGTSGYSDSFSVGQNKEMNASLIPGIKPGDQIRPMVHPDVAGSKDGFGPIIEYTPGGGNQAYSAHGGELDTHVSMET